MSDSEEDLLRLYRTRLRDRKEFKTKRRRQLEAPPKPVGDLLQFLFKGDSQALRKLQENKALSAWPRIVGEAASRISKAVRIRGTKLIVQVDDPLWMVQLSLLKQEVLKKYRDAFPGLGLNDIFFSGKA